jgi:hypothetical protein
VVDALILDHALTRHTVAVHPGQDLFTSSSDGGKTWSRTVEVGGSATTFGMKKGVSGCRGLTVPH